MKLVIELPFLKYCFSQSHSIGLSWLFSRIHVLKLKPYIHPYDKSFHRGAVILASTKSNRNHCLNFFEFWIVKIIIIIIIIIKYNFSYKMLFEYIMYMS
jgi:hypothetical protein